jgi:hypothetical protein
MRLCHYISLLFILSLYMAQCLFCNKHFSDSGLRTHTTKCTARTQRLTQAAAHGAEMERERVRIETEQAIFALNSSVSLDLVPEEVNLFSNYIFMETDEESDQLPPREPSPVPPRPSGRPGRRMRLPARYRDELPDPPTPHRQLLSLTLSQTPSRILCPPPRANG